MKMIILGATILGMVPNFQVNYFNLTKLERRREIKISNFVYFSIRKK